jgi:hypothetical protein
MAQLSRREADSIPLLEHRDAELDSPVDRIIDEITKSFDDPVGDPPVSRALEQEIKSWHWWFIKPYPATDPNKIFQLDNSELDFRVLFLAYPTPGYVLWQVLEACYWIIRLSAGF